MVAVGKKNLKTKIIIIIIKNNNNNEEYSINFVKETINMNYFIK